MVYNNTSLYLEDTNDKYTNSLKGEHETKKLQLLNLNEVQKNLMDEDLKRAYLTYTSIIKKPIRNKNISK